MVYKLGQTRVIHWGDENIEEIDLKSFIIWQLSAEIYPSYRGQQAIIIVAHPIILNDGIIVFSAILHTKAFIRYDFKENPTGEIAKMWTNVYRQEVKKFREAGKGTIINTLALEKADLDPQAIFNISYNLREAAIKQHLLERT